ncbi:hypothetical protein WA026_012157 [Henosepilachna vigintioctopunctata]|uniref:Sugar transporter SWEET n=1 Tax=Henosepilachna vigintioctopunctata TaxID=420089 RepID=A0AAW1V6R5_9CUCU
METLHNILLPYREVIGKVASVVTIGQFFAGVFICRDIFKQKSTKGISAVPFIGGVALGTLMLKYGFLLQDEAMLTVNIAAILINLLYVIFYSVYTKNSWEEVYKPVSCGVLLVAVCLGYTEIESPELLEYRYGMLITVLMLLLLGSPLKDVGQIISSKDASSIPFPITFMGAIVTFLWLLYGIVLDNTFMIVQNIVGFGLCVVQLVLILLYSKHPGVVKENTKKD